MSDLTLGNVSCPAPKHMIRLSVEYRQDLNIPIRLWKSLVEDTHALILKFTLEWLKLYIFVFFVLLDNILHLLKCKNIFNM